MALPVAGVRDAVLSDAAVRALDALRAFRHVVLHAYDYRLDAERVRALAAKLPETCSRVEHDLRCFTAELRRRIAAVEGEA